MLADPGGQIERQAEPSIVSAPRPLMKMRRVDLAMQSAFEAA